MRQTALIVLMAQVGSFVPADSADIGVVDRIFTRVVHPMTGQRTEYLHGGDERGLQYFEEMQPPTSMLISGLKFGGGTSTFDGLSIAWAVIEHIADKKTAGSQDLICHSLP